jgi:hypothetical protein
VPNKPPNQAQPRQNAPTAPNPIERDMVKWTRAVAVFTFFLVIVSAVSDFFIFQQWKVASDAQSDTRIQLKAVVVANNAVQTVIKDTQGKPTLYIVLMNFQNVGSTRTERFNAWMSLHYFDGDIPNNIDFSKPWSKVDAADTVIGPNSSYPLVTAISADDVAKASAGSGKIALWGHAEYSDVFEPKVSQPIRLCYLLNATMSPNSPDIVLLPVPYRNDCNSSGSQKSN